jgi:hypothetical protein
MQARAQELIRERFTSTVSDRGLVYEFNLLDSSVTQKLWSTEYYYNELAKLDIDKFRVFPPANDTVSFGPVTSAYTILDPFWYCRTLNRLLDGFFMNSMSVLDTLAHQIFTVFVCRNMSATVYITTARRSLGGVFKTGRVLDDFLKQGWFAEFERFRHCTTHESLIRYDDIKVGFDQVDNRYRLLEVIRLPDDPQARPFTFNKNREASDYCQFVLKSIQAFVSSVHDAIWSDIVAGGNVLPIPVR